MYYLFGHEVVCELLSIRCAGRAGHSISDPELLVAYNRFLAEHSIIEAPIEWFGPRMVDFEELRQYAPRFCAEKERYFATNSPALCERLSNGYFDTALSGLLNKEPHLAAIAQFCIRLIVINQLSKYTNGTTEDTLGVANFNFRDDFDELDFQELLVHQLVHMLLFIDDTLTPHMAPKDKVVPIQTGMPFVLGGTAFPAYLAFHSYIVAVEILLYRAATKQWGVCPRYHRSTARIIRIIEAFRPALDAHAALFTRRAQEILLRAEQVTADLLGQAALSKRSALDERSA